jgi:hypothetical protein
MDELVQLVSEKTGLSEEMSRVAVETVIDYLKGKLPESMGSQIDVVLANGDIAGDIGSAAKGLGSLFSRD